MNLFYEAALIRIDGLGFHVIALNPSDCFNVVFVFLRAAVSMPTQAYGTYHE